MKKRRILLALLALCLALTAVTGSAWAYFTTNTSAAGGQILRLGSSTTVDETMDGWTKQVTIRNDDASAQSVYLRARVFSQYTVKCEGEGWREDTDGYWYYSDILEPGASANTFTAAITPNGVEGSPTAPGDEKAEPFDVVVVYETTPVQYLADGTPYDDWTLTLKDSQGGDNA